MLNHATLITTTITGCFPRTPSLAFFKPTRRLLHVGIVGSLIKQYVLTAEESNSKTIQASQSRSYNTMTNTNGSCSQHYFRLYGPCDWLNLLLAEAPREPELLAGSLGSDEAELCPGDEAEVPVPERAELLLRPVPLGLLRLPRDRLLTDGRVPVRLMLEPSDELEPDLSWSRLCRY